ncbi:hypothetical protein AGMMS49942_21110 [Spirochaetia bacterium]|nr:hypothetical protein AGMMS49942_21110 [Spirochaetia bacterium]
MKSDDSMCKCFRPKPFDFLALGLSLGLTVFSSWLVYAKPAAGARVIVQSEGGTWMFPLNAEETLRLPGPLGETIVEIGGGRTWVQSSPCNNQTCVAAGRLYRRGQWTACLPNKVFIYMEGTVDENDGPDSTTW